MITATILWLALNLYHEARGEPDKIQIAVAQVTLNRAKDKNQTIEIIVKQKRQFSWRSDKKKVKFKPWKEDPEVFLNCSINAIRATLKSDITKGATHYHERRIKPKWAKKLKRTTIMGPFAFYKEKKK